MKSMVKRINVIVGNDYAFSPILGVAHLLHVFIKDFVAERVVLILDFSQHFNHISFVVDLVLILVISMRIDLTEPFFFVYLLYLSIKNSASQYVLNVIY